ncbi:hypothetical protein DFA_08129 [Cavenderia fasciculata]|uniref:Uncharacterized protein n=1 Tax=Cavenderia fasciculata TaxID=261658 RepID=F4Q588_CACFS|nr:uncharacterized protein DFA_08129 [Cavenderia fasciculata]EGG17147.1 hypothetical protein DFA_08129 [Cavenderia fasciculata]|eukprot:XP_004355631.1 hypothetical protein DFA_08129 [Cavenderia fasciculata]
MAVEKFTVRNALSFPVTFFALGGPTFNLSPGQKQTQDACAIWFSTRVQGPGEIMNVTDFEKYRDDYIRELDSLGVDPKAYGPGKSGGNEGVAAGSVIGLTIDELEWVFKIPNTMEQTGRGDAMYFGAKKEGVYGSCNLVVLADMDPCHQLDLTHAPWWHLRIETDNGQVQPPVDDYKYVAPDLDKYQDYNFVRFCNAQTKHFMCAGKGKSDDLAIPLANVDALTQPFDPLNSEEYFAYQPDSSGPYNIKLISTKKIGDKEQTRYLTYKNNNLYLQSTQEIGSESHTQVFNVGTNWMSGGDVFIKLGFSGGGVVAGKPAPGESFLYQSIDGAGDQQWIVFSYTVDVHKIPSNRSFKIVHCKTGLILCPAVKGYRMVEDNVPQVQGCPKECRLYCKPATGRGQDVFLLSFGPYINSSYYLMRNNDKTTGSVEVYDDNVSKLSDAYCWKFKITDHRAGFHLVNLLDETENLFWNGNDFGFFGGDYDDQLWVAYF